MAVVSIQPDNSFVKTTYLLFEKSIYEDFLGNKKYNFYTEKNPVTI